MFEYHCQGQTKFRLIVLRVLFHYGALRLVNDYVYKNLFESCGASMVGGGGRRGVEGKS